jgi:hypothetical protein
MAATRDVHARIPEALENRARHGAPELAHMDLSTLMRVGLAVLAGDDIPAAIRTAVRKRGRPPVRPRKDAV